MEFYIIKYMIIMYMCIDSPGWHEELDRKLSQHSLGELTKVGSKTTLNRRVREPEWPSVCPGK